MSPLPDQFLEHLRSEGYNSRSNKHSNSLASAIVADLLRACPSLADKAGRGEVVFELNFDLHVRTATWNVDLVLGRPANHEPPTADGISRAPPSTVQIAIEIKSVMTEHRKAVKNRKRDLEAHHEHVHRYNRQAIAGGFMVVNAATQFKSTLRSVPSVHAKGDRREIGLLVTHCLAEMRNISERADTSEDGMDAKCAIVVDMDNIAFLSTRFETRPPAPQVGDPLHYDAFLQRICSLYNERFSD